MPDEIKDTAARRLRLTTALSEHRDSLYDALTHHGDECVSHMIAVELLRMARWDQAEFIASYERFDLDG